MYNVLYIINNTREKSMELYLDVFICDFVYGIKYFFYEKINFLFFNPNYKLLSEKSIPDGLNFWMDFL